MDFATGAMVSLLNKLSELLKEELGKLLQEKLKEKYKLQTGVRDQVQSLSRELEVMHAALHKVAEVPRKQLDEQAKLWARDARELSYDMEDIVDTFLVRVEDGREATPNPHWLKQLMEKMGNWFSKAKPCHQIAVVIEDINKQLQEVTNRHGRNLVDRIMAMPAALTPIDPRLQALYREATELIGIDGKRDQELIKMLSEGDDVSKKKLKIVSVVGFGGLGKTTLAKAVYDKIKGDFDYSVFVSVGRNPSVKKVFMGILLQLDKQKYTNIKLTKLDEMTLIDEIREFLEKKRYLIIIDDIWDEENWKYIKLAFSNGNDLGSRLITTTRKVSVSEACCSSSDDIVYKMEPLSNDDSQRLFYQRIFSDRNRCPPELEQVSRDILKKCGGVPLAIITIASLLASNKQIKTKDEWYTLLNSIGRGLTEGDCVEEMQRILSFSYYDLPSHLKTCLLYLSIYPEDHVINRHELIWKWIAEGFIQCKNQQTSLFELGKSNFNELINRNMIQPEYFDRDGSAIACRVHDMMLDLIRSLSSEENFVNILDGTEQSTPNSQSKVRRLSLQNSMVDETTPPISMSQVRSITLFEPAIKLMPPLSRFDVLRVLDLYSCYVEDLDLRPVGNLFHLRYLGLNCTGIHELPEEIGNLQFLQVLDVEDNVDLYYLPSTIVKLRRLMCLLVFGEYTMLPDGMGSLTSMEVLRSISTEGCPNIVKGLHNLTRLRELEIRFGENESSKELDEAFVESLCNLHSVQSLVIHGYFGSMDLLGGRWVPPQHLRSFSMFGPNRFSTLPAWDPSLLPDLSELCINVKELRQEDLQILGRLPALRFLAIRCAHQPQRLLLVGADWFPCVIFFDVACDPMGHIMFQRGALPRAQQVRFPFDVQMAKDDGNGDFGSVLENLLSLRRVWVRIHHDGATDGEVEEAKAALRHAVDAHPNHPTIDIATTYRANDNLFYLPLHMRVPY